jgi:hypothetical protein
VVSSSCFKVVADASDTRLWLATVQKRPVSERSRRSGRSARHGLPAASAPRRSGPLDPHRTHGTPSVPNRPWRPHLPDGPSRPGSLRTHANPVDFIGSKPSVVRRSFISGCAMIRRSRD